MKTDRNLNDSGLINQFIEDKLKNVEPEESVFDPAENYLNDKQMLSTIINKQNEKLRQTKYCNPDFKNT